MEFEDTNPLYHFSINKYLRLKLNHFDRLKNMTREKIRKLELKHTFLSKNLKATHPTDENNQQTQYFSQVTNGSYADRALVRLGGLLYSKTFFN